ncbi:hypothetical protein Tco_0805063 [Tanacetum coccineum]
MSYDEIRPIFEKVWDFNQHIEHMEQGNEKMKSLEKIEEEDVDTQEEMKEVVKEPETKRKKSLPRKRRIVKRQIRGDGRIQEHKTVRRKFKKINSKEEDKDLIHKKLWDLKINQQSLGEIVGINLHKKLILPSRRKINTADEGPETPDLRYRMQRKNKEYLKYVQSLKKEVDELQTDKTELSKEYDLLLQECVLKDIMCSILRSFESLDKNTELQCLYREKIKECECLAIKLSKRTKNVCKQDYNELSKSFSKLEQHSISLELALQQCQEQLKNDKVWKHKESSSFRYQNEQYFVNEDLKAQLHDKNTSIRVIHRTSVSRPQLRSN